ncbi:hypothetical protein QQF64_018218 [Cirrhinus molitorella]|uniref:Uncharacterized protein n=1 Tax=Cirrhinus molitorella TaxID=172907 RepID=A0ABR3LMH3_9TELE
MSEVLYVYRCLRFCRLIKPNFTGLERLRAERAMKRAQMDLRRLRTAESIKNNHIVPHSSHKREHHQDWTSITPQPSDIIKINQRQTTP